MASEDIQSLFTNVPLEETTNIIVHGLLNSNEIPHHLNEKQITKALQLATIDSVFTFNDNLYTQTDGVAMGSPLGPTYANAFLCYHEKVWLNQCPDEFKPSLYRRYVDDTFLLFKNCSQVEQFVLYLNTKHPNLKFTYEIEQNSKLPFLDTLITKENGRLTTSVYRKPTFTGLGINYSSFSPKLFKLNSISTLINRAYNICSDYVSFDKEMDFLLNYFTENSYPSKFFYKILRNFLNKKHSSTPVLSAAKDLCYVTLPYLGHLSFSIRKELQSIFKDTFPQTDFRFIFKTTTTIRSLLNKTKPLPFALRSCVVYQFKCSRCNSRYVGSTTRSLQHRILEHMGKSYRTGVLLSSPSPSAIREHCYSTGHPLTQQDFHILTSASHRLDLITLESLFISRMKPDLNNTTTAIQLHTQ